VPKMKTNKSIKSKVKITASGKLMLNKPGRRHLLNKKSAKRKRHLKNKLIIGKTEGKCYLKRLGIVG